MLTETLQGVYKTFDSDMDVFNAAFREITFHRGGDAGNVAGLTTLTNDIYIFDIAFAYGDDTAKYAIGHEMGHVFDNSNGLLGVTFEGRKSASFVGPVWPSNCLLLFSTCIAVGGASGTPTSDYARLDTLEDFADTFAVYVANENEWTLPPFVSQPDQVRLHIVESWIALTVQNSK